MSKNLTRKGLALVSGTALALTSLVGVAAPASAAAGDVTMSPTTGTSYTVFNTDAMKLTTSVSSFLGSTAGAFSYLISNPDQHTLLINFSSTDADATVDFVGYKADGSTVTTVGDADGDDVDFTNDAAGSDGVSLTTGGDKSGSIVVDFSTKLITSLKISDMDNFIADAKTISITVLDPDHANSTDGVKTNTERDALVALGYGGDSASITAEAWLESSASTLVDATYASGAKAITFVDPDSVSVISKVERFAGTTIHESSTEAIVAANMAGQTYLGGSLRFSNSNINLDQVDLTKWKYAVTSSVASAGDDIASTAIALGDVLASGVVLDVVVPEGYLATNLSAYGKLLIQGPVLGNAIAVNETYKFTFRHGADTTPYADYSSAASEVPGFTSSAVEIDATVADSANTLIGAYSSGFPVTVRNGTAAVTFAANVEDADDVAIETANVPVFAKVTAGANFPSGATLTVSGTTEKVATASSSVFTSGLTDTDGEWNVTVTSSDTSAAGSNYTVEFFVVKTNGTLGSTFDASNATKLIADYAAGAYSTFVADSSVLSGETATVTFSVADQFGEALSADSKGKAYSVELAAPAIADLDMDVAVVDGSATFSFTNWLAESESDVITAKLYTGSATSPVYVSGATTSLSVYNTNTVYAVNVVASVASVVVTYDDFITGVASSTNVAPNDNSFTYIGTVVDSNGAGVPGAPVTISGTGFQFNKTGSTTYSVDSISLAASEAGTFSVTAYTHVANAAGNALTVTSGGKSATTLVKSAIPAGNGSTDVGNLKFSWDLPANVAMNTTYAVTATLTDKWSNPLSGASLSFTAYAAATFNGVATAVAKTTDKNGQATVYLRSLKDIDGISAVGVTFTEYNVGAVSTTDLTSAAGVVLTDVVGTVWDESLWTNVLETEIDFTKVAAVASADTKVNVGSFKGYVALYAKGYKGQKMTAIVAGKWIKVDSLASDFERVVRYTGAGYDIVTTIYIDGAKVETFNVTTK